MNIDTLERVYRMYRVIKASTKSVDFYAIETIQEDYPDLIDAKDVKILKQNQSSLSTKDISKINSAITQVGDAEDEADEYDLDDYLVEDAAANLGVAIAEIAIQLYKKVNSSTSIKASNDEVVTFTDSNGSEAVVRPNPQAGVTMIYFYHDDRPFQSAAKSFYQPLYKEGLIADVDTRSGFVEVNMSLAETAEELNNFGYFE